MFANFNHAPNVRNFAETEEFFAKTPSPTWRNPSNRWADDQRPLMGSRQRHYSIRQNDGGESYSLWLYSTEIARFHRPVDGFERRQYVSYPSITTEKFLSDVAGYSVYGQHSTDGREIYAPISTKCLPDSDFSLDIYVRLSDGRIDTARSAHTPIFKQVSGFVDKHSRKAFKEQLEPFVKLALLSMSSWESTQVTVRFWDKNIDTGQLGLTMRRLSNALDGDSFNPDKDVEHYVNSFLSDVCYMFYSMVRKHARLSGEVSHTNPLFTNLALSNPVTVQDLERQLRKVVAETARVARPSSERVPYAQFPDIKDVTFSNVHT